MNQLDYLVQDVSHNTDLHNAGVKLLGNIASEIKKSAGNAAAMTQLADLIQERASHLVRSVLAHTPMVLATPVVHPEPVLDEPAKGGQDLTDKDDGDNSPDAE